MKKENRPSLLLEIKSEGPGAKRKDLIVHEQVTKEQVSVKRAQIGMRKSLQNTKIRMILAELGR